MCLNNRGQLLKTAPYCLVYTGNANCNFEINYYISKFYNG